MRVNLPAKLDNYGNRVPDFELIPKYEQAMKEIRNIQTTDPKSLSYQRSIDSPMD